MVLTEDVVLHTGRVRLVEHKLISQNCKLRYVASADRLERTRESESADSGNSSNDRREHTCKYESPDWGNSSATSPRVDLQV